MRPPRYEIAHADRGWFKQIGWRSVEDVLAWSADNVAAVSRSSDVVEVPVDPSLGGPTNVFVKRYRYERLEQRIKQSFRGTLFGKSRAQREFQFLTEMRRRRVPTVRPIAYGDLYGRAFLHASFLITEGSEGYQSLDVFALDALRRHPLARCRRRELTTSLAATLRKMHDAGIRHGGLFLRNILVHEGSDGAYHFQLIDPDTHGKLNTSRAAASDIIADLSEVVASAMGLGLRTGLADMMKAYFQVSKLTAEQKQLTARIVNRAREYAPAERRRMAATEAIGWLRQRSAGASGKGHGLRVFRSVDDFFDQLASSEGVAAHPAGVSTIIRFSFSGTGKVNEDNGTPDRTVLMIGERVTVRTERPEKVDLAIRTDPDTWLAVISGRPDAYERLRAGRLRMDGDTAALGMLMQHLHPTTSPTSATHSQTGSDLQDVDESHTDSPVTPPSSPASVRSFGRKYKANDYARYYAEKHDSSLSRRISNELERRMIRRSLLRIRRHQSFQRVLDCPSGTGRFLPTLASLNVSVVAMDTSDAVLREGRKQHALFKEPPVTLAGSAFAIALPDNAVDVVLCSRLLHHIPDRDERVAILKEFARVARVGVVISFFDANSYRAWKRRRKSRRTGRLGGRHAITRTACVQEAVGVGLKPIGMNALLRFHTEITSAAFLC